MSAGPAILALVTDAFGGRGGIAQYNRDFLAALALQVQRITVLPRHAPDSTVVPAKIQQLPPQPRRLGYILRALVVAMTRRVDVVFCGHLYMAPLGALIARLKRAKLVVQAHGIESWSAPSRLRGATEAADLVLCVSRYTRARILDWASIAPERVVVLPNTVQDAFTPAEASLLRTQLGLKDKLVLLTVGRMDADERYKGQDRVIAALPKLIARGHDVVYVLVGDGNDVSRLKRLATNTQVGDRVRFMGLIPPERLVDFYRVADLFVMPSTGEGFGIAFLEAMASGIPALGLAVAGARDALADGGLGIAVAEPEFDSALQRVIEGPKSDGQALAAAVRARFGREHFAFGVERALERLLAAE